MSRLADLATVQRWMHDVLILPAMTKQPIEAAGWPDRSWSANFWSNARWAPFEGAWNFAQYPAAAVPAAMHTNGTPIGVQLVGSPNAEGLLLSVAKQLEQVRPWPRYAPMAGVSATATR